MPQAGTLLLKDEPKKPRRCRVELLDTGNTGSRGEGNRGGRERGETDITISVSHELAPKLSGAVLDFGKPHQDAALCLAEHAGRQGARMYLSSIHGVPSRKTLAVPR